MGPKTPSWYKTEHLAPTPEPVLTVASSPASSRPFFFSGEPRSAATPTVDVELRFSLPLPVAAIRSVPLGRCPDCPRTAPLKRLVTTSRKNGNLGWEHVKCESKPELGKNLGKCTHFEWFDQYIKMIEIEGASLGLNLPLAVEQLGSATGVATVGKAEGVAEEKVAELGLKELKKMNKQLVKLVNLKKQDNLMAGLFLCVISLGFVYLEIISR